MEIKNNKKVVISNKLIESKLNSSALESRLFLKCVSVIGFEEIEFEEHELLKSEMLSDFGLSKKSGYAKIKKAIHKLNREIVIFDKSDRVEEVHIFSKISYMKNQRSIKFIFSPHIREYLLQLKGSFTSLELKSIYKLKTNYSIKLYMLLKQYLKCKQREIALEDLIFYLGLNPETTYGSIKRILTASEKDLKRKADVYFSFRAIKTGKKVTSVLFFIETTTIPELENYDSYKKKESHFMAEEIFNKILDWEREKEYIIKKLDRDTDLRKNRTIGYLLNCIRTLGADSVSVLWEEEQFGEKPNMFNFLMRTLPDQMRSYQEEIK